MNLNDKLKKAFKGALHDSADSAWCNEFIPTGCVPLDRALGGGFGEGRIHEVFGPWSSGKGQPASSKVITPVGFRCIGDLKVGDLITGANGMSYPVTGIFPKGPQPVYRVSFSDRTSLLVDADHQWQVMSPEDRSAGRSRLMSTADLASVNLFYGKRKNRKWSIPLTKPVQFFSHHLPLDPYVMGVLLGDGSLTHGTVSWTNNDPWFAEEIAPLLPGDVSVVKGTSKTRATVWRISGRKKQKNPVTEILRSLGLKGCGSSEKFIPWNYLCTSIENRCRLLQGLLDTDGAPGTSGVEYVTVSEDLAAQVVFLVQSLGGIATTYLREKPTYTYKGKKRIGKPAYRISIRGPDDFVPFKYPQKKARYRQGSKGLGRWITAVEYVCEMPTICISVASPDNLYLTEHFIVTHNTLLIYQWLIHVQMNLGGKSFLFESEGGFAPLWYIELGGILDEKDPNSLLYYPDLKTVEDFFDGAKTIIQVIKEEEFKGPVAIGWDSIAATGTKHLQKEGTKGSRDMTKAFIMDQGTKWLVAALQGTRVSVVAANQERSKIGAQAWEATHTPGGKAWPYFSAARIELALDGGPSGSLIISDEAKIGRAVRGEVVKNKMAPPFRTFKAPIYTEAGHAHPTFKDTETQVGIDKDEALLNWYLGNERATFGPDRERYLTMGGAGRIEINEKIAGMKVKRFLKRDWKKVLETFPQLRNYDASEI